MPVKTFPAQVTNGQLRFQESLADLEGQRVLVTLLLSAPCEPADQSDPADAGPPEWLETEQNVVFRMPFRWEPVQAGTVATGPMRPRIILPEELPDE